MTHGVDEYYFFRVYCEKKNINLQYCDALIDFLKNHEGIYEPQDVSFPVLDKFLTYWFIRVYLNYNQKTVDEIINLVGEFIRWNCLSYLRKNKAEKPFDLRPLNAFLENKKNILNLINYYMPDSMICERYKTIFDKAQAILYVAAKYNMKSNFDLSNKRILLLSRPC